jgi:hypothetical protein
MVSLSLVFLGGGVFGVFLGWIFAPDSKLAAAVGLFMLPLAFAVGMQLWLGLALFIGIVQLIRRLFKARGWPRRSEPTDPITVPSGSFVFLPVAIVSCALGGLVTASVASTAGFMVVCLAYMLVGILYGVWTWRLAKGGFLPFLVEV